MNQINNIQVGNQTYQIGGTGSGSAEGSAGGSAITRGDMLYYQSDDTSSKLAYGVIRPNRIYTAFGATTGVFMGLPQEILSESGEVASLAGYMGLVVDEENTEIEGYPTKISVPYADITQMGSLSSIPELPDLKYGSMGAKMCVYSSQPLSSIASSDCICKVCLIDNTVLEEDIIPGSTVASLMGSYLWRGKDLVIALACIPSAGIFEPLILVADTSEEESAYADYPLWGEQSGIRFYAKSKNPGSECFIDYGDEQIPCLLMYFGSSYMKVDSISHYIINMSFTQVGDGVFPAAYITNIPCAWDNNTAPDFTPSTIVQASILDGIGSFNTIDMAVLS